MSYWLKTKVVSYLGACLRSMQENIMYDFWDPSGIIWSVRFPDLLCVRSVL